MAKINECIISVDLANAIREVTRALGLNVPKGKLGFLCPNPKCRQPVKPMRSRGNPSAHFEHLKRNANCELSHVRQPGGR